MKKHLCRLNDSTAFDLCSEFKSKICKAACDSTLTVPYHNKSGRNRRLNATEIIKQMDKGNVCKACIRIVVVERLNGIRPDLKLDPKHKVQIDFTTSVENLTKVMATMRITTKKVSKSLDIFTKAAVLIMDKEVKINPPIISIPKDFSWKARHINNKRIIGDVTI